MKLGRDYIISINDVDQKVIFFEKIFLEEILKKKIKKSKIRPRSKEKE